MIELMDKKPYKKCTITLKNGLKATIAPLEDADEEFVCQHKKQLLNRLKRILGKGILQNDPVIYIITFHFNRPAYAVCFDINFRSMINRFLSNKPEEALTFCSATIINGLIQTHIYVEGKHCKTLWAAIKNKTEPEIATLLRPFPDELE